MIIAWELYNCIDAVNDSIFQMFYELWYLGNIVIVVCFFNIKKCTLTKNADFPLVQMLMLIDTFCLISVSAFFGKLCLPRAFYESANSIVSLSQKDNCSRVPVSEQIGKHWTLQLVVKHSLNGGSAQPAAWLPAVAIYHSVLPISLPLPLWDSEHVIWSQQATSQAESHKHTLRPAAAALQATQFAFQPQPPPVFPTSIFHSRSLHFPAVSCYLHSQGCTFPLTPSHRIKASSLTS